MIIFNKLAVTTFFCIVFSGTTLAERIYEKQEPPRELTAEQAQLASANYQKYCSL